MNIPAPLTNPVPRSKRQLGSGATAAGAAGDASNAKVVLPFEFVEIVKLPSVGVKSFGCSKTRSVRTPVPATVSFGKPSELSVPLEVMLVMSKVSAWFPFTIVNSVLPSALLLKEKLSSVTVRKSRPARLPDALMTTPGEVKSMLVGVNVSLPAMPREPVIELAKARGTDVPRTVPTIKRCISFFMKLPKR